MLEHQKIALFEPKIIAISSDTYIKIQLYQYREKQYYEVSYVSNSIEKYIGKYEKWYEKLGVSFSNGKILVYNSDFNTEKKAMSVTKVLTLYDIEDDTFYACTQEEALKIFDENIDSNFLKNGNKYIVTSDIEKKKRLRLRKQA